MKHNRTHIASKATALVEDHSVLATLLAVLCLVFAVNFFLTGPGSDGGSGLGGTGKFGGGESGLGGTGKMPDGGAGFKLGASDAERDRPEQDRDLLGGQSPYLEALRSELDIPTPRPEFDVASLRLSPPPTDLLAKLNVQNEAAISDNLLDYTTSEKMNSLVANINLNTEAPAISVLIESEQRAITANTLVASLDILNSLMLAEAATEVVASPVLATATDDASEAIRQRVTVPVRPERPDRFTMPSRIAPVQRVDVPAPPPVRPMRTMSTLLNH